MDKPVYIGGPMSGIAHFNFPAFDAAAAHLRGLGWDVVSPSEMDIPEVRASALASPDGKPMGVGGTWGDFLSRDVKVVADDVSGIVLLPGWAESRGAVLETTVGLLCKHRFFLYDKLAGAIEVPREFIKDQIMRSSKL